MAHSTLDARGWGEASARARAQGAARQTASSDRSLAGRFFLALEVARERRALAAMTPEQLKDIGISADEAQSEASRPFWDLPSGR